MPLRLWRRLIYAHAIKAIKYQAAKRSTIIIQLWKGTNYSIESFLHKELLQKLKRCLRIQGILNYRDLDYCNPPNARIYKKFQVIWLSGLFTNKSSQNRDPDNRGVGFFFDYWELFLDIVIPKIEDPLYLYLLSRWDMDVVCKSVE